MFWLFVRGHGDRAIILHGHTDTVGVEDYGRLKPYAFDIDALGRYLGDVDLPEDAKKDLASGDYLFDRGACDMKSGDAVFLHILKDYSRHPEDLDGNILVSFNPVEENQHTA